jgi:SAM-dependent methyltransferase
VTDESHYLALAAAYARGALGRPELDEAAALAAGREADLKLHRFKRTSGLPRVKRVIGALRGFGVERLIDVGSGRGAFLWPMVDALPWVEVTAIDLLAHRVEAIEAVRRGGVARVTAARMDARQMGFADACADVVTLLEVIEHMEDPTPAVAEALRVARIAIVITVPSHEDNNPEHLHLFDGVRLEALCKAGGARRVSLEFVPGHIVCTALR